MKQQHHSLGGMEASKIAIKAAIGNVNKHLCHHSGGMWAVDADCTGDWCGGQRTWRSNPLGNDSAAFLDGDSDLGTGRYCIDPSDLVGGYLCKSEFDRTGGRSGRAPAAGARRL